MKFDASLLEEMQELSPPKDEEKKKEKKLYLRFTISGFKVTISKDLRLGLFKDRSKIKFMLHKQPDEKNPITKTGKKNYKKQIITVYGVSDDDENALEIKQKGDDGHDKTYYFVKLSKSQMAELDETLLSTINYVTSRKYIVPESAINEDLKCLQIDLENRKKPYFSATKKSKKVIAKIEAKAEEEKKERKRKAEENAKLRGERAKNKVQKSSSSVITETATGAHQIGRT